MTSSNKNRKVKELQVMLNNRRKKLGVKKHK